jgi:phenylpropionate dioxygenase-like ring-hydroxylating dioxygenase large terminal subunit
MLTQEQNELVCETGRGTPLGEVMRRYWQPVELSSEIKAGCKPKHIKVMGEDLVLFRDDKGKPGLLGLHCSHRLTSLAYGRVEDGGLRCPFHGWLYDVEGRCLEQPAEPEPFADKIRHLAYPCEELGGLIFAYMGPPEKKPLLPRYEVLVREDGTRKVDSYLINSNYLQNLEGGALDPAHASYLHADSWSTAKYKLATLPRTRLDFWETDYGIRQKTYMPMPDINGFSMGMVYNFFIMPNGLVLVMERDGSQRKGPAQKFQSWFVPMDDTHTIRFQVGFAELDKDQKPYEWPSRGDFIQAGPQNDYFRNYEEVDTISGIPGNAPGTSVKGFLAQDNMVNESQGPIVDRSREHLGAFDKVVAAARIMLLTAIREVQKGQDPKHIIRDTAKNNIVVIS